MNKTLKKVQLEKAALELSSQVPFNHGRAYDEVADRQKKRKVRTIKTAAEQALCFIDSFGLSVEKVVLKSTNDEVVELNYSSSPLSLPTGTGGTDLDADTSVDETLYLLEKFGVSDECYHELIMLHPNLPHTRSRMLDRVCPHQLIFSDCHHINTMGHIDP